MVLVHILLCVVDLQDGRLRAGDEIVQVDQHSLRNLTREEAARILTQTGQVVRLHMLTTQQPITQENSNDRQHDQTVSERLPSKIFLIALERSS